MIYVPPHTKHFDDIHGMTVLNIENLANLLGKEIVEGFKNNSDTSELIGYDKYGNLAGDFVDAFRHRGLYGFLLDKDDKSAVVYIGKSEGGDRLRQHLTGKNKNSGALAKSVNNKNMAIRSAIAQGFNVKLCLFSNEHFGKPSMSCLEISAAIYSKSDCSRVFPEIEHWNNRIG
jgi:hypothetical protein